MAKAYVSSASDIDKKLKEETENWKKNKYGRYLQERNARLTNENLQRGIRRNGREGLESEGRFRIAVKVITIEYVDRVTSSS